MILHGDCRTLLPTLADASVNCVITDPPYPEVPREYGRWTEDEWQGLLHPVVQECRRVLTPTGSAVIILQPNSQCIGRLRPWFYDFLAWCCRTWNVVQDVWWWNTTAPPAAGANTHGLLRPSVKACVWLGEPDCYRCQDNVLWETSQRSLAKRESARAAAREYRPSGHDWNVQRAYQASEARGGVTPYNLLPIPNASNRTYGHGAGTPYALADWWIRYICPPGGTVLDPFAGSGTIGVAARARGRNYIGMECYAKYVAIAKERLL